MPPADPDAGVAGGLRRGILARGGLLGQAGRGPVDVATGSDQSSGAPPPIGEPVERESKLEHSPGRPTDSTGRGRRRLRRSAPEGRRGHRERVATGGGRRDASSTVAVPRANRSWGRERHPCPPENFWGSRARGFRLQYSRARCHSFDRPQARPACDDQPMALQIARIPRFGRRSAWAEARISLGTRPLVVYGGEPHGSGMGLCDRCPCRRANRIHVAAFRSVFRPLVPPSRSTEDLWVGDEREPTRRGRGGPDERPGAVRRSVQRGGMRGASLTGPWVSVYRATHGHADAVQGALANRHLDRALRDDVGRGVAWLARERPAET